MPNAEKVVVEISAEDKFSDVIKKFNDATDGMAKKSASSFKAATDASKKFALALAGAGAAVGAGLLLSAKAAMDAEVQMARFDAVLGSMGKKGSEARAGLLAAADAAAKMGFDDEDAAESLAKLFQRTGDVDQATKLNNVAMDLARSKNIDLGAAATLVGQVLSGNGKVLKQYGIDIKDTATPLEALSELQEKVKGQSEAFTQTLAGQWAILSVQIGNFMEEVGTPIIMWASQGLFAVNQWLDSMGGVAGVFNLLQAGFQAIQPYLPIIAGVVAGAPVPAFIAWGISLWGVVTAAAAGLVALAPYIIVGGAIAAVAYMIYEAWTGNWWGIRDTVMAVIDELSPYFENFVTNMSLWIGQLVAFFQLVGYAWSSNMYGIRDVATVVWTALKIFFKTSLDTIIGIFKIATGILTLDWGLAWEGLKEVAQVGMDLIGGAWSVVMEGIQGLASSVWNGVKDTFVDAMNWIIKKMNAFISALNGMSGTLGAALGLGKRGFNLGQIPTLADGAIVAHRPGGIIANIGEGRYDEAVVPLRGGRAAGLGGITIQITGNSFFGDDERFAEKIGDQLVRMLVPHIPNAAL